MDRQSWRSGFYLDFVVACLMYVAQFYFYSIIIIFFFHRNRAKCSREKGGDIFLVAVNRLKTIRPYFFYSLFFRFTEEPTLALILPPQEKLNVHFEFCFSLSPPPLNLVPKYMYCIFTFIFVRKLFYFIDPSFSYFF